MAATATISATTSLSVVSRSAMTLVSAPVAAGLAAPLSPPSSPTSSTGPTSADGLDNVPLLKRDATHLAESQDAMLAMASSPAAAPSPVSEPASPPPSLASDPVGDVPDVSLPGPTLELPRSASAGHQAPIHASLLSDLGPAATEAAVEATSDEATPTTITAKVAVAATMTTTAATEAATEAVISTTTASTTVTTTPTSTVPAETALTGVVIAASTAASASEATTFFDDVINARQPPANILTLSPTTSLPELYHDFFDNHPELFDSDPSSDPEMDELMVDLDGEDYSSAMAAVLRARAMGDKIPVPIQAPLIADRPKLETIDTINLMLRHHPQGGSGRLPMANHAMGSGGPHCFSAQEEQAPQRRKKASRACFHCQKAHLTCDDSRPCQRCVKRDLAGSCTDGIRKKAKYLQDSAPQQQAAEQHPLQESPLSDAQALFSFPNVPSSAPTATLSSIASLHSALSTATTTSCILSPPLSSASSSTLACNTIARASSSSPSTSSTDTSTTPRPSHGFGSEAINLEYTILSTMLSSPSATPDASSATMGAMATSATSTSSSSSPSRLSSDLSLVENWQRQGALEAMANSLQGNTSHHLQQLQQQQLHRQQQQQSLQQQQNPMQADGHRGSTTGTGMMSSVGTVSRGNKRKFPSNTPENVYANTKQPFNYTEGFHYLLRYVRERMDKEEMMRICRAMAMFRPSFIALIMNLTPEDLVFMETCFQRTILEFEKLISFSGTPTVVWRRTGEIALVGKEFSLLTQWSRDQLVGKKTYIYELMDHQSAVEYWEKFSTHAFENTEQTVMTTCILLSPTNRVVPCTFCFTIKRDIFDIPLAIVGNFLPILS